MRVLALTGRATAAADLADTLAEARRPGSSGVALYNLGLRAYAYARAGQGDSARVILARIRDPRAPGGPAWRSYAEAMVFVGFQAHDSALVALRRGVTPGRMGVLHFCAMEAAFAPLHRDPRWAALYREAGLRP
jgi:hypothetical protein